jgi:hypothetical protein
VIVSSGSHEKRITVDQTQPLSEGQTFRPVGIFHLESGVETVITINNSQTDGFVIVDALQWLPVNDEAR